MTWPFERLDNVAELCLGKMLDRQKNRGTLHPYLRNINVRWGTFDLSDIQEMPFEEHELERYSVRAGDVVICEGGEPGRCAVWTSSAPFFIQKALHRVRCSSKLSPEFLSYWLRHLAASGRLARHFTGSTIHHLPGVALAALAVPFPPVGEQTQVVAAIDTHFSRIEVVESTLKRAKANVKRARASVLKAAVEGRLVPTEAALARAEGRDYEPASTLLARILTERHARWPESGGRGKYKEPVAPEAAELAETPEGWVWATVDQLGRVETGTTPSTQDSSNYAESGLPFLKPTDLDQGGNVNTARQFLSPTGAAASRRLPSLSVLVTCIGATIGKVGLARMECATNQQINALIPGELIRDSRYIFYFFQSPAGQREVIGNASATTLPILNKSRFSTIAVPLPPLAEQYRIVAEVDRRLSVLDALDATLDANLARCAKLRQSILKRAFEGKLVRPDAPAPAAPQLPLFTEEAAP